MSKTKRGDRLRVVILDCGFATSARPLTWSLPKSLLTVANVRVLSTIIGTLRAAGIARATLCLRSPTTEILEVARDTVPDGFDLTVRHTTVDGSVPAVREAIGDYRGTVLVVYGDNLLGTRELGRLIALHTRRRADATILTYDPADMREPIREGRSRYGVLVVDRTGRVRSFVEKPLPRDIPVATANAAVFTIETSILRALPPHATDFSRHVFENSKLQLYASPIGVDGFREDVGYRGSWRQLNLDVLSRRVAAPVAGVEIAPGVWIDGEVEVRARLQPPVAIGFGSRIHDTATIINSVIGENVLVGARAVIRNSVILGGSRIDEGAMVDSTVIGEHAVVMAGAVAGEGTIVGADSILGSSALATSDPIGLNRRLHERDQRDIHQYLDATGWDLRARLVYLWKQQVDVGFITADVDRLRRNRVSSGRDYFFLQFNELRHQRPQGRTFSCPIDIDKISPIQHYYSVSLNGRIRHMLANPFPLSRLHFCMASAEHEPQRWADQKSLRTIIDDVWSICSQLPSFAAFYNGASGPNGAGGAGCTIEDHLHFHVLEPTMLYPLQNAAKAAMSLRGEEPVLPIMTGYPLAAIRVSGSHEFVVEQCVKLVTQWREIAQDDGTENILGATENGDVVLYIIPRRGTLSSWGLSGVAGGLEAWGEFVLSSVDDINAAAAQRIGYDYLYSALASARPPDVERLVA